MIPGRRLAVRRILACGLAAACLLLGGCIYLRLLELKLQLGNFDRHFALETADGLTLVCRSPVLRADDVRWIGLKPATIRREPGAEHWQVRWVKQLPPGVTEPEALDLALDLDFTDGRLARAVVAEKYFALMPKSFVADVIRSTASGQVDKSARRLQTTVTAQARPDLPAIRRLLGVPSEEHAEDTGTSLRYRYVPVTPEAGATALEMTLRFATASGELLRWHARTPVGSLAFDFAGTGAQK
ncbi:MAG: hypothetical protein JNL39_02215 [Opitutaceae bacterium]|nr:hypothetical protein [Opitutaceae bacterium]